MCMGFAVYEDLARQLNVPLDVHMDLAPAYAVGNAMHVANVGSVTMLALLCIAVRA